MTYHPAIAIALLALTSAANAEPGEADASIRTLSAPPLRAASRLVVRPETNPTAAFEIGVQAWRNTRWKLDVNVGFAPGRALGMTGPPRSMQSLDGTADLVAELGPWLETGPSAGVAFRLFRQEWTPIDELFVPVAGWRLDATVVRTRRWSVQLSTKAMVDVFPTDFIRETAEVRRLLPIEGQVGIRVNLGHGRVRTPEDDDPRAGEEGA